MGKLFRIVQSVLLLLCGFVGVSLFYLAWALPLGLDVYFFPGELKEAIPRNFLVLWSVTLLVLSVFFIVKGKLRALFAGFTLFLGPLAPGSQESKARLYKTVNFQSSGLEQICQFFLICGVMTGGFTIFYNIVAPLGTVIALVISLALSLIAAYLAALFVTWIVPTQLEAITGEQLVSGHTATWQQGGLWLIGLAVLVVEIFVLSAHLFDVPAMQSFIASGSQFMTEILPACGQPTILNSTVCELLLQTLVVMTLVFAFGVNLMALIVFKVNNGDKDGVLHAENVWQLNWFLGWTCYAWPVLTPSLIEFFESAGIITFPVLGWLLMPILGICLSVVFSLIIRGPRDFVQ